MTVWHSVDCPMLSDDDQPMGRSKQLAEINSAVTKLQRSLSNAFQQITEIRDLLALEGEERQAIPDLNKSTRSELRTSAIQVEQLRDANAPTNPKVRPEVMLMGTTCSAFIGMEVVALNLLLDALSLTGVAEGDDLEYLRSVIINCATVYDSHLSMVESTLRGGPDGALMFSTMYRTNPDTQAATAAFNQMVADFPQFRVRVIG